MKIKTSELSGAALDWAVATREEFKPHAAASIVIMGSYTPSTNWSQGGPIIEQQLIHLSPDDNQLWWAERRLHNNGTQAYCTSFDRAVIGTGPTPLIAAMRCYVASKLGNEVEVPDELVT